MLLACDGFEISSRSPFRAWGVSLGQPNSADEGLNGMIKR